MALPHATTAVICLSSLTLLSVVVHFPPMEHIFLSIFSSVQELPREIKYCRVAVENCIRLLEAQPQDTNFACKITRISIFLMKGSITRVNVHQRIQI